MIITFDDLKKEAHDYQSGKVCSTCKEHKSFSEYYSHSTCKDGLNPKCKSCHNEWDGRCKFKKWFRSHKSHARKRNVESTIEPTDIPGVKIGETIHIDKRGRKHKSWEAVEYPKVCPVLGIELDWNVKINGGQDNSPSLDRIDSTKGYIPGNVMIMSKLANAMKSNATSEHLVRFSKYMLLEHGE